jgi:hypothetical protein
MNSRKEILTQAGSIKEGLNFRVQKRVQISEKVYKFRSYL